MNQEEILVKIDALRDFVIKCFKKLGVPKEDAATTADVLITSDRRGIDSHGVARLLRYVNGIRDGVMIPKPEIKVVHETPLTAVIDGGGGLGQVVGVWAMKYCIKKAKKRGLAFVVVRNSNHYGIAAYYAMMALEEDMIGISLTNSAPLVVPTFGKDAVLGTNPISVAIPAYKERPFVYDGATSTVPRGKLEVYDRQKKPIPLSWATDADGKPTSNPREVLDNLLMRRGGGLLPLGGATEEEGGHKGYCLSALVDIFTGVLSGGAYASLVEKDKKAPAGVCHFLGAIKIDSFAPKEDFKKSMDDFIRILKNSKKAEGKDRIYVAGEKEFELQEKQKDEVALSYKVVENLRSIGKELGVRPTF